VGSLVTKPAWLWFTIVLLAGTLGEAGYGVLNAALAFMLVIGGLASFGGNRYIVREVARRKDRAGAFFSNFVLLQATAFILILALAMLLSTRIGYTGSKLNALFFAGIYAMAMALTVLCRAFYRAFEEMKWDSVSQMAEKAFVIAFGTALVVWKPTPVMALAGMAAGMVLTLLGNLVFVSRRLATFEISSLKADFLRTHVVRALPLGLISFFTLIYFRTDQVMVEAMAGEAANGQYSMAYRLIEATLLLPLLLSEVLFPRLSNLYKQSDDTGFRSLMGRGILASSLFSILAAAVLFFFARPIVDLIRFIASSDDFILVTQPLQVLAWTLPFMAVNGLLCAVLTARDDQMVLAVGFGIAALFNIVVNLFLIPLFGPVGAGIATLATEALITVGLVIRFASPAHRARQINEEVT
jgi:O-antigen/teichoic acid export membrane protein